ncbi:hypothetical protein OEZ75_27365, partial [Leclercia adecarboxylata]|nr:hypothetical protein [Leclercia adecarboxylata]
PGGTLIFKWCEVEVPLARVLALTPEKPLFGHRSGKKAQTHWCAFLQHNAPHSRFADLGVMLQARAPFRSRLLHVTITAQPLP